MKIKGVLLLTLVLGTTGVFAQTGDAEAREKYLQAEAAFTSGSFAESLSLLNETETLLGRKTPKVQFLKVLVYERLALADVRALPPAMEEIKAYLDMRDQLPVNHLANIPW